MTDVTSTIRAVIAFEVKRTLHTLSFWLTTLMFPVLIVVVGAVVTISSQAAANATVPTGFPFEYTDPAGLIDPDLAEAARGVKIDDAAVGVENVKAGRVQAFIDFPADPTKEMTRAYGQDLGLIDSAAYASVAHSLLMRSAAARVGNQATVGIITGQVDIRMATFADGQQTFGMGAVIAPLMLAIMFFLLIMLLANRMLAAFIEEKENRVAEISLTTMSASTMLAGKVISLFIIGLVQMAVIVGLALLAMVTGMLSAFARQVGGLADAFAHLTIDPTTMTLGVLILLGGFLLNTTSVVTVGMIMPNAREAGSLSTPIVLLTVGPLYLAAMMVTMPDAPAVQALTFIPWMSTLTGLIRNAVGNLPVWQAVLVIVEEFAVAAVVLWFANKISRFGLISYDKAVDVRGLFRRSGRQAKV